MSEFGISTEAYVNVAKTLVARAREASSVGDIQVAQGFLEVGRQLTDHLQGEFPDASVPVEEIVFEAELAQIEAGV